MYNPEGLCQVCRYCDPEKKKVGIYRCLLGEQKERTVPVDRCDYFFPDHLSTLEGNSATVKG
ncbi:hypothetical protein [Atribacter laminatus]|uniref:Uncharacterized protein n=1 Tax=Atribacter laminatus TaxID=2847778 RepID=A0A7T1AJV2_ATRLM|nr:hypothetical protein [Atribacter laminatus]QPM67269.1 hypothetical protein RT761_00470 [Atribacter laminatus]